ncbi:Hsp20/alpha crystallin family protein [Pendulispora albinea]|uniref:Hsp20/alpha crystallin family protein n=1 Tax=Pendulispora albinea TaxID=2741071 RepID=A0ABZ2LYH7_9BACT
MSTNQGLTRQGTHAPERVQQRATVAPLVDVYENRDEVLLVADLPGAAKDSIHVHLDKGQLTIEATRAETQPPGTPVASEYQARDYHRIFAIPQGIDGAKIAAQFADGVLCVRLPKSESLKPRRIEVRAG